MPAVVAINAFPGDNASEIDVVREVALEAGARDAVVATAFRATAVRARRSWPERSGPRPRTARPTSASWSPEDATLRERIEAIATRVYGADGVDFSGEAGKQLHEFERLGYGELPVCMAKTRAVAQPRSGAQGPADGLPGADSRRATFRRGRIRDRLLRRHADDARAAVPAVGRARRHRRERRDSRSLLGSRCDRARPLCFILLRQRAGRSHLLRRSGRQRPSQRRRCPRC